MIVLQSNCDALRHDIMVYILAQVRLTRGLGLDGCCMRAVRHRPVEQGTIATAGHVALHFLCGTSPAHHDELAHRSDGRIVSSSALPLLARHAIVG